MVDYTKQPAPGPVRKFMGGAELNVEASESLVVSAQGTSFHFFSTAPGRLLSDYAVSCHKQNQHWWTDPATGNAIDRDLDELLCLVVSEVSEALEGERKDQQDTHLPKRKMAEVELADVLIRCFDIVGAVQADLDTPIAGTLGWKANKATSLNELAKACFEYIGGPLNKGRGLMRIVRAASGTGVISDVMLNTVFYTLVYAGQHGYDLDGAVAEKRTYNANRLDHKNEARLGKNGKKF